MTYQEALTLLNGKQRRKLENNTYLIRLQSGTLAVKLHDTNVVKLYPNGDITLNSGGWQTLTTKNRMNKYSPVRVLQVRGKWLASYRGVLVDYHDGLTVS